MSRTVFLIVGVALLVGACADDGDGSAQTSTTTSSSVPVPTTATTVVTTVAPPTSVPTTGAPTTTRITTTTVFGVPDVLSDFDVGTVRLEGRDLVVAIADTSASRAQGLMGITDLASLDGMVFIWDGDTTGSFWMRDTLIPLDIAWFDASGRFVSGLTMPPCPPDETCPTYDAAAPYRYALEMPEGTMPDPAEGSVLELVDGF